MVTLQDAENGIQVGQVQDQCPPSCAVIYCRSSPSHGPTFNMAKIQEGADTFPNKPHRSGKYQFGVLAWASLGSTCEREH